MSESVDKTTAEGALHLRPLSSLAMIETTLRESWDDPNKDLFPKDRRMSVLAERGVEVIVRKA